MDYEFDTEGSFDVEAMIGDFDVDYDDESLTLPDDEMFEA